MKQMVPLALVLLRKMLIPVLSAFGGAAAAMFSAEYQAFCGGVF